MLNRILLVGRDEWYLEDEKCKMVTFCHNI